MMDVFGFKIGQLLCFQFPRYNTAKAACETLYIQFNPARIPVFYAGNVMICLVEWMDLCKQHSC